jgi:hypothetical protein
LDFCNAKFEELVRAVDRDVRELIDCGAWGSEAVMLGGAAMGANCNPGWTSERLELRVFTPKNRRVNRLLLALIDLESE